jgi:DNA replicative helicase MCM subunit Mcm2 (Cdc46/Mcm family)
MGGPLLSRFDIVILLMDHMDPAWDNVVATHILHTHKCRGGDASSQAATNDGWGQQQQQQQSGTAAVAEVSRKSCTIGAGSVGGTLQSGGAVSDSC